jgi:hypothetical protein
MIIKASEELLYWIGVVQSDGCLNSYYDKKRNTTYHRISVTVSKKSLPMLKKFQVISNSVLGSNIRIYSCKNETFKCTLGAKNLIKIFKDLKIKISDPPIPPKWVFDKDELLGSYIAGLIDGDGNVNTGKNQSKCTIEIFSHDKQFLLKSLLRNKLKCGIWIRKMDGCYGIGFRVSHKNYRFIENYVLPHLAILHKADKLKVFINEKRQIFMGLLTEGIIFNLNRRLARASAPSLV